MTEPRLLLNPRDAARAAEWGFPVEVSPDVPAGTAYLQVLPGWMGEAEPPEIDPNPRARCTITDPRLDPPRS